MLNYLVYLIIGVLLSALLYFGWGFAKNHNNTAPVKSGGPQYTTVSDQNKQTLADNLYEKGRASLRNGDYDDALKKYKEAATVGSITGKSEQDKAVTKMMEDILEYGDFRTAVNWCEQYLDKHPEDKNPETMLAMSDIYNQAASYKKAEKTLSQVMKADSLGEKDKFERIPYLDYVTYCLNEAAFDKNSDKNSLLDNASKQLKSYIGLYGEDSVYFKSLAELSLIKDDYKSAVDNYKQAVRHTAIAEDKGSDQRLKFGAVEANFVMTLLNMWSGSTEDAKETYRAGFAQYNKLKTDETDRFVIWREVMLLGNEMYLGGDRAKSADFENIEKEVESLEAKGFYQDRFHKQARKELGEFMKNRESGNYKAAVDNLDNIIALFENTTHGCPDYYVVRPYNLAMFNNFKGDLYLKMGQMDKARESYEKARKAAPHDRVAPARLSMM